MGTWAEDRVIEALQVTVLPVCLKYSEVVHPVMGLLALITLETESVFKAGCDGALGLLESCPALQVTPEQTVAHQERSVLLTVRCGSLVGVRDQARLMGQPFSLENYLAHQKSVKVRVKLIQGNAYWEKKR